MSFGSEFSCFYLVFYFAFARRKENIEDFLMTFFLSKKVMRMGCLFVSIAQWIGSFLRGGGGKGGGACHRGYRGILQ